MSGSRMSQRYGQELDLGSEGLGSLVWGRTGLSRGTTGNFGGVVRALPARAFQVVLFWV